jgi:hypothetical protein
VLLGRCQQQLEALLVGLVPLLFNILRPIHTRRAQAPDRVRERNNDDLADLLVLLHRDGRLVLTATSGKDPLRIVCSMETVTP